MIQQLTQAELPEPMGVINSELSLLKLQQKLVLPLLQFLLLQVPVLPVQSQVRQVLPSPHPHQLVIVFRVRLVQVFLVQFQVQLVPRFPHHHLLVQVPQALYLLAPPHRSAPLVPFHTLPHLQFPRLHLVVMIPLTNNSWLITPT